MLVGVLLPVLVVAVFVAGARRQPSASAGLLAIPDGLLRQRAINELEWARAVAAARGMASWRRRGAFIGAVAMVVPVLLADDAILLGLVAILAGAAGGLGFAQWWQTKCPTGAVRVARLERRTVVGLVGAAPLVLFAVSVAAVLAATTGWLVQRSYTGDKVLVSPLSSGSGSWTCRFHLDTPPLSGPALGWVGALVATVVAIVAAQATSRRGADATLAFPADLALRQAGIRTALGCGITVMASLAVGMLFMLRSLLDDSVLSRGHCGSITAWDTARSDLLLIGALVCVVIAMTGLLSYVLFPGRIVPLKRQPVPA